MSTRLDGLDRLLPGEVSGPSRNSEVRQIRSALWGGGNAAPAPLSWEVMNLCRGGRNRGRERGLCRQMSNDVIMKVVLDAINGYFPLHTRGHSSPVLNHVCRAGSTSICRSQTKSRRGHNSKHPQRLRPRYLSRRPQNKRKTCAVLSLLWEASCAVCASESLDPLQRAMCAQRAGAFLHFSSHSAG